jgi:NodT family efflux transporter outer membrane factor (OMF) lipoprotein
MVPSPRNRLVGCESTRYRPPPSTLTERQGLKTGRKSPPRRVSRFRGATTATALAMACPAAVAAPPSIPRVPVPAVYEGQSSGERAAPSTLDRWWLLFGDQTLNALEGEAFRGSTDARTATARILEARATRAAQTAQTLPSGSITGNASRQETYAIGAPSYDLNPTSGVTNTATGNFNVSWELDLFGRLAAARRVAKATAAEARFNVEGTLASLAADVADNYFQAKGLVIQLEDARATVRIQSDLLAIARKKAAAGAGPMDDIDRVAAQEAQAEAQATDLQAQLDASRRRLLILVGRDLAVPGELDLTGAPPDIPITPRTLPSELLSRRPDVREAEYRLRAEFGTAKIAHLAIFPTITLLPGLGLSSITAPGVSYIPPTTLVTTQQTTTTGFWTLAAGVSAPTLDIPRLLYQAHAEDARTREAAIAYEQTVRTAFGEAQNALVDLAAGEKATTLLVDGEERARRAYDGSRRRYAQGLDDLTAALSAEQSWRSIRSALTSEKVDTLRRAVRTYKALGGGWAFGAGGGNG